jgi:Tfp pilus assembly protein PilF
MPVAAALRPVAAAVTPLAAAVLLALLAPGCSRGPAPEQPLSTAQIGALNHGLGLMGQFDFEAARLQFQGSAQVHGNRWGLTNAAIALMNQSVDGAQERAIEEFRSILRAYDAPGVDTWGTPTYCIGLCELYLGRPEQALQHFRRCAEAVPGDPHASFYVGQCLELTGADTDALAWYRRAAELDPFLRSAQLGIQRMASRTGDEAAAEAAMQLFDRLAMNPRSTLAEFKYTRMGAMGMCIVPPSPMPEPARGPMLAAPRPIALAPGQEPAWSASGGASVCAVDLDGDGALDLVIPGALMGDQPNAILRSTPEGFVLDGAHPLSLAPGVIGVLAGDLDHDGRVDLLSLGEAGVRAWMQTGDGWQDRTESLGLAAIPAARDGVIADLDHDGDLDLAVVDQSGALRLFAGIGGAPMREITDRLQGEQVGPATQIALGDVDGDRDVDLLLAGPQGCTVWCNDRLWAWSRREALRAIEERPARWIACAERSIDGAPMILLRELPASIPPASMGGSVVVFLADTPERGAAWSGPWQEASAGSLQTADATGSSSLFTLADLNGDLHHEVLCGEGSALIGVDPSGHQVWIERAPQPATAWAVANLQPEQGPSMLATQPGGPPVVFGPGSGRGGFAAVDPRGRIDPAQSMRSNASGIGTRLTARIGREWSSMTTWRVGSGPGQSLQPVSIGLGPAPHVDALAIDWSDGVTQSELWLMAGSRRTLVETQRQISSCPVIFAWNGREHAFVTDCLGVGGLGYLIEPGVYAPPRPWEHVVLPPGTLVPEAGEYRLKLAEPMEEACWIDGARLIAWDLPAGWSMAVDERMGINDPQPTGKPVFWRTELGPIAASSSWATESQARHPSVARDDGALSRATDASTESLTKSSPKASAESSAESSPEASTQVLAAIARVDRVAADPGPLDHRLIGRLQGDHALTIEFDRDLSTLSNAWLVMDGWIEYPYCQTMFAAWQSGAAFRAPSLEARAADGTWIMVAEQFGYPAGMPRRALFPVPALPAGSKALRLTTNHQIYWDRIAIALAEPAPVAPVTCAATSATIARRGYALRSTGSQFLPHYDDARAVPLWDCRTQVGAYTALGACLPLVTQQDDACAIFAGGEELQLTFTAPAESAGTNRHWVLELDGWCKDMDLFTKDGETLDPQPMRGERRTSAAEALHERFNTRRQGGR